MQPSLQVRPVTSIQKVGYKQLVLTQIKDTLNVLRPYFDDDTVNEIMVNAPNEVFISKMGKELRVPVLLISTES